jgi:RNA-binding protein
MVACIRRRLRNGASSSSILLDRSERSGRGQLAPPGAPNAAYNDGVELTEKQRRHLRGLGHSLKPVIQVGQAGVSDAVVTETDRALDAHELIKVRVAGMERDQRDEALLLLANRTGSEMVGRVGHTAVLYRRHPRKARISLP